jgi:hypothetical protein
VAEPADLTAADAHLARRISRRCLADLIGTLAVDPDHLAEVAAGVVERPRPDVLAAARRDAESCLKALQHLLTRPCHPTGDDHG